MQVGVMQYQRWSEVRLQPCCKRSLNLIDLVISVKFAFLFFLAIAFILYSVYSMFLSVFTCVYRCMCVWHTYNKDYLLTYLLIVPLCLLDWLVLACVVWVNEWVTEYNPTSPVNVLFLLTKLLIYSFSTFLCTHSSIRGGLYRRLTVTAM